MNIELWQDIKTFLIQLTFFFEMAHIEEVRERAQVLLNQITKMERESMSRTIAGDARMRIVGINPDANPSTAVLAAVVPLGALYLARTLPPNQRGCDFNGRFDREDISRNSDLGPPPGEGGCDYPGGCRYLGSAEMQCPHSSRDPDSATA